VFGIENGKETLTSYQGVNGDWNFGSDEPKIKIIGYTETTIEQKIITYFFIDYLIFIIYFFGFETMSKLLFKPIQTHHDNFL